MIDHEKTVLKSDIEKMQDGARIIAYRKVKLSQKLQAKRIGVEITKERIMKRNGKPNQCFRFIGRG